MIPPFISYFTFNRLGLTVKSLPALLNSTEDFELHIIDSNSKDNTWEYIMSLDDSRIKTKEHFEYNHGKTYALNLHLTRRLPEQYFLAVDNQALITTKGWIGKLLEVFEAFPEAGLLGAVAEDLTLPKVVPRTQGPLTYLELNDTDAGNSGNSYIPDDCMGLRPGLIKKIGYFSEENYFGAVELSYRVCQYTGYKAGFVPEMRIQRLKTVACGDCAYSGKCTLGKTGSTCFSQFEKYDRNQEFQQKYRWRYAETVRDMQSGARPVYCASLLDAESTRNHIYNREWALDNMVYFIKNTN